MRKESVQANRLRTILREWTLPLGMSIGAASYLLLSRWPLIAPYKATLNRGVSIVQPVLIFAMLFLTFCRVSPSDIRLHRWHLPMLLLQCVSFILLAVMDMQTPGRTGQILLECAMLCMVCPTATAAAVVTRKLGGDVASVTTYTLLINTVVAILFPLIVPLVHEGSGGSFLLNFYRLAAHTFPLLVGPMLLSIILRWTVPRIVTKLAEWRDAPFYLWAVSLSLAIAVTVKSISRTHCTIWLMYGIAIISLIACIIQFSVGRWLGQKYQDEVSATQAYGQKNTVLIIWMGFTFLSPITSLAGGFYSIWHNVYNSYQLYKQDKAQSER